MTEHSPKAENQIRRRLLQAGAALPVMVTIKSARAQTTPTEMMLSIACMSNSEIPATYQMAVDEVAKTLNLSPTPSTQLNSEGVSPNSSSVPERPGGWIGERMAKSFMGQSTDQRISTEANTRVAGADKYADWSYEDFESFFSEGSFDFYPDAQYDPSSQYHNTFLEITMSTACWASIQNQTA